MTNYEIGAITGVVKFLWHRLEGAGWQKINGLTPIIESQQEPEILESGMPFIVYNWSYVNQGTFFELSKEQAVFVVYGDQSQVRKTVNMIVDLFKRMDWAAEDVNNFIHADLDMPVPYLTQIQNFDYKSFSIISATGPDPAVAEDGRHEGVVMIQYSYTHPIDDAGLRA